ncbi:hypothetical protein BDR04DRAFT_1209776 [Suillus decipiens]|nr:hypothetical protein BDR04DRAFT_1209776 [Suillus decipiens]
MIILLFWAILFCAPFVCASFSMGLNDTCTLTLDASDYSPCNTRTLWNIVSSCGLTLFACTWTALHLDIPPTPTKGVAAIALRGFACMLQAFIVPEVVTAHAALQLKRAFQAKKRFNALRNDPEKWSLKRGFFAEMGGFVLHVDDKLETLKPKELLGFVTAGSIDMPVITEEEIEDRSKADLLSKCVAISQLGWFVAQFAARYKQNLSVTLLEVDTLGITTLTIVYYFLWLKKPKNIKLACVVHWKASDPPVLKRPEYVINVPGRTCSDILAFKSSATTSESDSVCCRASSKDA